MRDLCLVLLVLLSIVSPSVSATSYVPVTDEALVDHAPVIAVVEVRDSGSNVEGARPATVYRMRVERAIKGEVGSGQMIEVRVPGGVQDGRRLRIWGAPRFEPAKRALLFLALRPDGSYEIVHLMLGAFHEVTGAGHRLALRNLSEARPVVRPGEAVTQRSPSLPGWQATAPPTWSWM